MNAIYLITLVCASSTLASPIPSGSRSTNGSQCLAIILSLVAFVSFLFAAKHVYLIRRGARTINKTSFNFSATTDQSSSSFLCFPDEKAAKGPKLGFLVGFFGSPTWETRINVPNHSSRYSLLHRFRSSLGRGQSSSRKSSLYEFGERRPTCYTRGVATECTGLSSTLCASHPTPSPQVPADYWESHLSRTRRHSLPTVCQPETLKHKDQRTRHSSLKNYRRDSSSSSGRRRSICDGAPSPPPIPSSLSDLPSVATSSPAKSRAHVRRDAAAIPPLPPLPLVTHSPRVSGPTSTGEASYGTSQQLPLTPALSKTHQPTPIDNLFNSAPHSPKSAILPSLQSVTRTSSTRCRRSPALGPSPLRLVTLPEMSISEFGTLSPRTASPRDHGIEALPGASSVERQCRIYPSIGLGRPSTWGEPFKTSLGNSDSFPKEETPMISGPASSVPNGNGSKVPHEEAEELILEIIRDLVEETSGWDSSLHMEDSFRSLIQNTGITPQNSKENMRSAWELTIAESVVSPVEIDFGLLELDTCAKEVQGTESRFLEHGIPLTILEEEEEEEEPDVSR
ncbi:hypothetical protein E1B28_004318 [Marasmius oreades]|uniref:Uncharacterized protein n=1 Tax=Marasmius oreades TaxID=181124 RepID=A0A9P8ACV6_9AGAR|nr:uncharacterized protein E1B28_004318 [Marasmius oreades]KAG7096914.1 hypothetical protein E1B28_004318 [Marasmius oreades]